MGVTLFLMFFVLVKLCDANETLHYCVLRRVQMWLEYIFATASDIRR